MRNLKLYKNFQIFFSKTDWQQILLRAEKANMKPSTYIREMALNGGIVVYDMMAMNSLTLAITRIGTNINQIVHLANEVHSVNLNDVKILSEKLDRIINEMQDHKKRFKYGREIL
jgi:hypothetical protein